MSIHLVGAIDIGTSYSGWAYSFATDSKNIRTKHWNVGHENIEKTPTCLLLAHDKTFVAFGDEAQKMFAQLVKKGEHEGYYFFRQYKNMLKPRQRIHRDMAVFDDMGKSLPAIDVFSKTIHYLADDMLSMVNQFLVKSPEDKKRGLPNQVDETNVLWVMTVPAIWTQAARRFMREAALEAGLTPSQIILALEPEVASIYSQTMSVHETVDDKLVQFPIGTRYILLDAGGGTVDLSIHEVEEDLTIKEVAVSNGESWGASLVNETIEDCLIEIFGEDIYTQFKKSNIQKWIELMHEIEHNKKKVHPTREFKISLNIPTVLIKMLEEKHNKSITEHIKSIDFSRKVHVLENQFIFTAKFSRSFFAESISKITTLIENQLQIVTKGVPKTLIMVGGFSNSAMIQKAVKSAFRKMIVAVSKVPTSAVLRGAVKYGHHPMSIRERILKYTYGVEVMRKFIPGKHPEGKRVKTDRGDHCKHVFSKHVEKHQAVQVGVSQVEQRYTPSHNDKTSACLKLFVSSDKNPQYTDDKTCSCIGEVTFDLPDHDGDLSRGLWVCYTFSGPEILVDVYDEKSGTTVEAKTWFLGPSMN